MPVTTSATRTYIAVREHPVLGELVKIGISVNPKARCSSLGARQVGCALPHRCERELKQLLQPLRAWPKAPYFGGDYRARWRWEEEHHALPYFSADSEWFLLTAAAKVLLNAYVRFIAEQS